MIKSIITKSKLKLLFWCIIDCIIISKIVTNKPLVVGAVGTVVAPSFPSPSRALGTDNNNIIMVIIIINH